jgi:hypothetical protein
LRSPIPARSTAIRAISCCGLARCGWRRVSRLRSSVRPITPPSTESGKPRPMRILSAAPSPSPAPEPAHPSGLSAPALGRPARPTALPSHRQGGGPGVDIVGDASERRWRDRIRHQPCRDHGAGADRRQSKRDLPRDSARRCSAHRPPRSPALHAKRWSMCRAIRSTLRCVKRWHPAGISASRPPSFSVSRIGSRRRQPGNRYIGFVPFGAASSV